MNNLVSTFPKIPFVVNKIYSMISLYNKKAKVANVLNHIITFGLIWLLQNGSIGCGIQHHIPNDVITIPLIEWTLHYTLAIPIMIILVSLSITVFIIVIICVCRGIKFLTSKLLYKLAALVIQISNE